MASKYSPIAPTDMSEEAQDDFKKWSKGVNPKTGRKIKVGGPTWLRIGKNKGYIQAGLKVSSKSTSKTTKSVTTTNKEPEETFECPICIEDVPESQMVRCPCGNITCEMCARRDLIESNRIDAPTCPNVECTVEWTNSFIYDTFARSWMISNKADGYRAGLKRLLLTKMKEDLSEANDIVQAPFKVKRGGIVIPKNSTDSGTSIKQYLSKTTKKRAIDVIKQIKGGVKEKRYIFSCSKCEGLVCESDMTCSVCETVYCPKCREIAEGTHVCDPGTVQTVREITSKSKPCPKCATPIIRSYGCDHMACTHCKTAFSWITGRVTKGRTTNPYALEWERQQGTVRRQQGDVICGGMPSTVDIERALNAYFATRLGLFFDDILNVYIKDQLGEHMLKSIRNISIRIGEIGGILEVLKTQLDESHTEILYNKIMYVVGKFDDKKLKTAAFNKYRRDLRRRTLIQILQTLHDEFIIIFRGYINLLRENKGKKSLEWLIKQTEDILGQSNALRVYINSQLVKEMNKVGKSGDSIWQYIINYDKTINLSDIV